MTENPRHYSNISREPHEGDRTRCVIAPGRFGAVFAVDGLGLAQVNNGWPSKFELVQPWWAVDAKPGTEWESYFGRVWSKRNNGLWSTRGPGVFTALVLEDFYGPGELVTPEPAPVPEPTAPGVVVRGTINGKTAWAMRGEIMWMLRCGDDSVWYSWGKLLEQFDAAPTIIDTDQPIGLTEEQREALQVAAMGFDDVGMTPFSEGLREAFPDVLTEPEPGADIPDEVVEAALAAIPWASDHQLADVRAAIAAADAKRAELEEATAAESSHTLAEVLELARELVENDRDTLRKLLERFNAPRVRELKPEQIDDFYAALAAADAKRAEMKEQA